ncbi:hypothetical protein NLJ89_g10 [Agrocybe chaxingu]|uniref:SPX domain-containing protein n=1 Tax=Agrocybe chaxingu TaxID=84603 RepID=A0A9W8TGX0_9AGAR|nr:hypothetical protein NLJ89_g10 [Agrocybe chaxingu]
MKFSSSLKFNAVADWWDEYIAYDALKKYIYQLEKQQAGHEHLLAHDIESNERSSLLRQGDASSTDSLFIPLLDRELKKIVLFYEHQEKELLDDLEELERDVELQEEIGLRGGEHYQDFDEEDEEDDDSISRSPVGTRRRRKSSSAARGQRLPGGPSGLPDASPVLRRQSISSNEDDGPGLETSYASLQPPKRGTLSKLQTKLTNMRDSITSSASATVEHTIWTSQSDYAYDTRLLYKRRITTLYISFTNLKSYVEINYSGFRKIIKKYDKVTYSELKDRYLHEVVEVALPFTQTAKDRVNDALNRLHDLYAKCVSRGDKNLARQQLRLHQRENIAWERDTVWRQMIGRERRGEGDTIDTAGATLVQEPEPALVDIPTPVGKFKITKRKILKVVAAIPLFVTSMFVPLLLVLCRVIRDNDDVRMNRTDATKYVFSIMFSPTIMLLIGGFTISSALSKTNIDRVLITRVLNLAGTRPSTVLLAFMGVSCFASMWISNVAAPTLCFTLIRPILRTLPPKSSFGPCLILAIALAANIGGQSSPISSPQNLIALQYMDPPLDWGRWFIVALPVSAISILIIWLFLLVSYRPARSPDGEGEIEIKPIRPTREAFTLKQYWVTFVCIVTIGLWCIAHQIEEYIGDMGVIAIIPIVAFFSTNVLKKDDFEHFMWTIVFLAMGGIALGKGVVSSGLLDVLDIAIRNLVTGVSLYGVVMILSPVVLILLLTHLLFTSLRATQENELGEPYLTNVDFLKNGVPASIIATLVVSTVGFILMRVIGL